MATGTMDLPTRKNRWLRASALTKIAGTMFSAFRDLLPQSKKSHPVLLGVPVVVPWGSTEKKMAKHRAADSVRDPVIFGTLRPAGRGTM